MVPHTYSMWQIAVWITHWLVQSIRDKAPYVEPISEPGGVPVWWHNFYADWDWWTNFWPGYIPTPTLINLACRGTWQLIGLWAEEGWEWAKRTAIGEVRSWTGRVKTGFATFSVWINWLEHIAGTYVPWWCDTLAMGVTYLYNWIPWDVRTSVTTWVAKFQAAVGEANAWAWGQFQAARDWVYNSAPWVVDWINILINWYNDVGQWIVDFRNDPYGTVAGWLGYSWTVWVNLREGLRTFYNTVWTPFRADMFAFFDHPMLFLYDKTEDYLCERW